MKAYRIVGWREWYECTNKGSAADASTPDSDLKRGPMNYIRWRVGGRDDSPGVKRLKAACKTPGRYMDARAAFSVLIEIAGQNQPKYRGWIVSADGRPYGDEEIASIIGFPVSRTVVALRCLCDPAARWMESAEYTVPRHSQEVPGVPGVSGKCQEFPAVPGSAGSSRNVPAVPDLPSHDNPNPNMNGNHTEPEHEERGSGGTGDVGDKSGDNSPPSPGFGGVPSGSALSISPGSGSEKKESTVTQLLHRAAASSPRHGEPAGIGRLLESMVMPSGPVIEQRPEVKDAGEIAANLAILLGFVPPAGFRAEDVAMTREHRQYKADVVCLVRIGAHIACGRMGGAGQVLKAIEKKCKELVRSPTTRNRGTQMRILIGWTKKRLARNGYRWS